MKVLFSFSLILVSLAKGQQLYLDKRPRKRQLKKFQTQKSTIPSEVPSFSPEPSSDTNATPSMLFSPSSALVNSPNSSQIPSNSLSNILNLSYAPSSDHRNSATLSVSPSTSPSSAQTLSQRPGITQSVVPSPSGMPSGNPSSHPPLSVPLSSDPSTAPSLSLRPSSSRSTVPSLSNVLSGGPSSSPSLSIPPSSDPSTAPSLSLRPSSSRSTVPSLSDALSGEPSSSPSLSIPPSSDPSTAPSLSLRPSSSRSTVPSLSDALSGEPSSSPSLSVSPSSDPSTAPSLSQSPSAGPSIIPSLSNALSGEPSSPPSLSVSPSSDPSIARSLSQSPSINPFTIPSLSDLPSSDPSGSPSLSVSPSSLPSTALSLSQILSINPPTIPSLSDLPSGDPSSSLLLSVFSSSHPSIAPSFSQRPSRSPSAIPSLSNVPSSDPSASLSLSASPSSNPSIAPSLSQSPSVNPSTIPSLSDSPFGDPSSSPSLSVSPSSDPSIAPSLAQRPSHSPSIVSTMSRSNEPSLGPSRSRVSLLSLSPSLGPSSALSLSQEPSGIPSSLPSLSDSSSIDPTAFSSFAGSPFFAASSEPSLQQKLNRSTTSFPSLIQVLSPQTFDQPAPSRFISLPPTPMQPSGFPTKIPFVSNDCTRSVTAKHVLFRGSCIICSLDRKFLFGLDLEGDLGIWKNTEKIWSAGTMGATSAILQLDGNLVVRNRSKVLWETRTTGARVGLAMIDISDNGIVTITNHEARKVLTIAPSVTVYSSCPSEISGVIHLYQSDRICSRNGEYTFGLSIDGTFGIWHRDTLIWSPSTCCDGNKVVAVLQVDGNFILENIENKKRLWSSQTSGKGFSDAKVTLSDDGILTIVNKGSRKIMTINPFSLQHQEELKTLPPVSSSHACIAVSRLSGYAVLNIENFLCSANKRFRFGVDSSGNLGLFDGYSEIWSSNTCCAEDGITGFLQLDNNLVVRNSRKEILWSSRTHSRGHLGYSSITLSDSGMVALTNSRGQKTWAVVPSPPKAYCRTQKEGRMILKMTEFICSEDGRHRFGIFEGDLSLWEDNRLRWSAGTCCSNSTVIMKLRYSGELVVVNERQEEVWSTPTGQNAGASLRLDKSGKVYLVSSSGVMLWSPELDKFFDSSETDMPIVTPSSEPVKSLRPSSQIPLSTVSPFAAPLLEVQPFHGVYPSTGDPSIASSEDLQPPAGISQSPSTVPIETPTSLKPKANLRCMEYTAGFLVLKRGEFVCSPNRRFKFGMSFEGDLVLFDVTSSVWKAKTIGSRVVLQHDCNLVVYSTDGKPSWSTRTHGNSVNEGFALVVGDDGVAAIKCPLHGYVWSTAVPLKDRVKAESLTDKVMTGYQGWFHAKGDGGWNRWNHWSDHNTIPSKDSVSVDMWPDVSELDPDELFPTGFTFPNGTVASLYSASNSQTVERHCRWMQNYGIDGLFLQRFIGSATRFPDVLNQVMENVRSGAEKYGRVFSIMYDISNGNHLTLVEDIIEDWKSLVDEYHITKSQQYLHHRGRPLLGIWGFGVWDREVDYHHAQEILNWLQYEAEPKYRVSVMGGVPAGWRNLSRDSKMHISWETIYRRFEVISPWTVGRYVDQRTADSFLENYIIPDMLECATFGIDYLPVAFPGFSAHHLMNKALNSIPRFGGDFLWRQLYNVLLAGNRMLYIAMFDEVDEGTAIFKIAPTQAQVPREASFVSLDADGIRLPSDW
eukprot:CAMPEP_0194261432 /NCGR_PEP_ID=MMETSP0158-20130606/46023_1 /TAXON_ID=33649 /ORGANISM="Thalassionema nitzschioides, Strain L26-B" /LENGTH=1700 /DNA_ID=CAMNT_0039001553 /DNA_START=243 /DNA_END=5342 /DNA_ORIENTATION=+